MKLKIFFCQFIGLVFLMICHSCQPEYRDNARIFVEGKINGEKVASIPLKIYSGTILVTETKSSPDGSFKMGGPQTTGNYELSFNKKISSFSTNVADCKLDYDSMTIILPAYQSYFNFTQINLAP